MLNFEKLGAAALHCFPAKFEAAGMLRRGPGFTGGYHSGNGNPCLVAMTTGLELRCKARATLVATLNPKDVLLQSTRASFELPQAVNGMIPVD